MRRVVLGSFLLALGCRPSAHLENAEPTLVPRAELAPRPPVDAPAVQVTERIEHYPVEGVAAPEVRASMQANGPEVDGIGRATGLTAARFRFEMLCGPNRDGYAADRIVLGLEIVTTYPEWTRRAEAPASLRGRWEKFFAALVAHEEGHRDRAIAGAERLRTELVDVPSLRSCEDVEAEMLRRIEENQAALDAEQAEFDRVTNHGAAQGVVF